MLRRGFLVGLLGAASCARAPSAAAPPAYQPQSEDDAFLDHLAGDWAMQGAVQDRAVRYRARGERVLGGPWFAFHMIDENTPAQYEASVFISVDPKAHDYVVHWLDSFGGGGARIAGRGYRQAEALRFEFPYADDPVRNVWTRSDDNWSLLIESQQPNGLWTTFAHYDIRRPV